MARGIFWILLVVFNVAPAVCSADQVQRILLLHSFGAHFSPFASFSTQFRADLVSRSPKPLDIYEASLEMSRFSGESSNNPFIGYLTALFSHRQPDLVVTFGGPAASFAQVHRSQLFPSATMLVTALDERFIEPGLLAPGDSAVAVRLYLPGAIDNVLRLRPKTRRVFIVIGHSPLESYWQQEAAAALKSFGNRLTFEWSSSMSFEQILARAAKLPEDAVVLYGLFAVDARGVPYEEDRALVRLHEEASVPMFGLFDSQLGKGIVGGPLVSTEEWSSHAADVALRMLDGNAGGIIESTTPGTEQSVFDDRELVRWGISEASLPSGSTVLYREPTVWKKYGWQIVAALTLFLAETALLAVLFEHRRRLSRATTAQSVSEARLNFAAQLSGIGMWAWDIGSNEIWLTEGGRALFGWPSSLELHFDWFIEAIHRDDRNRVRTAFQEALAGNRELEIEYRLAAPAKARWLASRGRVEFDASGKPVRMRGVSIDISERNEAVAAARELSGQLIHVHEDERSRLARELHDDVTQRLAVLAMNAGRGERDPDHPTVLQEIRDELVRLSEDVHSLSYRLHPSILEELGLEEALQAECDHFAELEGIPVSFEPADVPQQISSEIALCLFRVTQEALRNVGRHAGAHRVRVSLTRVCAELHLSVGDNGKGFDHTGPRSAPSLGLASMRQRIELVGGRIEIESRKGRGTTVLASVPIQEESHEQTTLAAG